jgi:hypothetical protein
MRDQVYATKNQSTKFKAQNPICKAQIPKFKAQTQGCFEF